MLSWMQHPFFWILLSLIAWAMASRWMRRGGEVIGISTVAAILPLAWWGYASLTHAAFGNPYRPGTVFWVCALILGLYAFTPASQALLTRRIWTVAGVHGFRAPAWWKWILLVVWGTLPAWMQTLHLKQGVHWLFPIVLWAAGIYVMLRHVFPPAPRDEETALDSAPFTTDSVSWQTEDESPSSDEFGVSERAARLILCAILVLAAGLYLIHPESYPTDVHGDEGEIALYAMQVRDSGNWNPFIPGWFGIPRLFYLIPGWGMWLMGDNLSGLRWSVGLVGLAAVIMVYFAARRMLQPSAALMATFMFAVSSYFIHFSREGNGFNQAAFFYAAAFYCLARAVQERSTHWLAWTGVVCGVGWLSYQANQLLAPLVLASIGVLWLLRVVSLRDMVQGGLVFVTAFWIAFSPMAGSYWDRMDLALGRMQSITVVGASEEESRFEQVWRQTGEALYAPLTVPNRGPFLLNRQHGGMMDPLPGVLLVASLIVFAVRMGHPAAMLTLLWAGASLFIGGAMTDFAPSYQRLIGAFPFLALMAAPALYGLCARMCDAWRWQARGKLIFIVLIGALMVILCKHRYFHQIMGSPQLHDDSTRVARYMRDLGPHTYVFFFGHPYYSIRYGNIRFLAPETPGQDVAQPEALINQRYEGRGSVAFVLIRSNREHIDALRRLYPGGREIVHKNTHGHVLFITYEVNL